MTDLMKEAAVQDFQSIRKSKIRFGSRPSGGGLTLIVGPSSTGKSAVLRALRLLAYNSESVPVRDGAKSTRVAVEYDSGTRVGIERGKSLSTYVLGADTYTKAGKTVPKDVENFLALYGTAHFAFQFDLPYLLGEPGAAVTKVLGEVTNAHVLSEAVREGVRRKMAANALARTRRGDAEAAEKALERFASLPARKAALEAAREALEAAEVAETEARVIAQTAKTLADLRAERAALQAVEFPDVSEWVAKARTAWERAVTVQTLIATVENSRAERTRLLSTDYAVTEELAEIAEERVKVLRALGVCPLCGKEQH